MSKNLDVVSANDVAAEVLEKMAKSAPMTTMKLQKLVYYCQAWSLVWDEEALYEEELQAWANGPIVPELYQLHRGKFTVDSWPHGDPNRLKPYQKETIKSVVDFYGDKTGQWLSELTHIEDPWKEARQGLAPGERGGNVITHSAMAEYYGSL